MNDDNWISRKIILPLLLLVAFLCLSSGTGGAASIDIRPTRIFLDERTKLEKLTLKNTGETDIAVQIKTYKWSQNEKGEDVYDETRDIVVFPKMVAIKKGEEKYLRIGTNAGPGAIEKTYRLYVEEMPVNESEAQGSNVRFLMKVGVPLFIKPLKEDQKAEVDSLSLERGKLGIKVKNKGNLHFIVTAISVKGESVTGNESFAQNLSGWYILPGSSKTYTTPIAPDACRATSHISIDVKTDKRLTLQGKLAIEAAKCTEALVSSGKE